MTGRSHRRGQLLAATAIITGAIALSIVLRDGGGLLPALAAFWQGSLGTWYALTSATLVRAIPLALTGTAVAIAFRGGVFNIGAEGQLLAGATGAAAIALWLPHGGALTLIVALAAGAAGGAAWAGIAAALRARFGVLEVISTIMLNYVALHAVSWLVRGPLQEPTHAYPQTSTIDAAVRLPHIPGAGRLHLGIVIALAVVVASGWVLRHTAAGFRLRATGESTLAAASAGLVRVDAVMTRALLVSGAFAGLAGAIEVLGVTFALYEDLSPGYGYTAIAVALLGGLDPWKVAGSALLFAALESGAGAMQRDAGIPSTVATIVEATLILAMVAIQAARARSPAATRTNRDAALAPGMEGST